MIHDIGVAGCGRMGAPMLAALRAAGFAAGGLDLKPPAGYGALSAVMTSDPAAFGEKLGTVFTVVRDEAETDMLLFGMSGLIDNAPVLQRLVICSTLSPRYTRALRERVPCRIALTDAPMSGAAVAAEERRLSFMLGGDPANLDALQPMLSAMGQHFHRMGPFGSGMTAKVLNNLLAAASTAMTRLVLDWADVQEIDAGRLLRLIETSSGQNWFASGFEQIEFARDGYAADNTIGILAKDIEAALDAAPEGADTALPQAVKYAIQALTPR